jgi:hypothetical protein
MATKKGTELQVTFFFTAHGCFLVENHILFFFKLDIVYAKNQISKIFCKILPAITVLTNPGEIGKVFLPSLS